MGNMPYWQAQALGLTRKPRPPGLKAQLEQLREDHEYLQTLLATIGWWFAANRGKRMPKNRWLVASSPTYAAPYLLRTNDVGAPVEWVLLGTGQACDLYGRLRWQPAGLPGSGVTTRTEAAAARREFRNFELASAAALSAEAERCACLGISQKPQNSKRYMFLLPPDNGSGAHCRGWLIAADSDAEAPRLKACEKCWGDLEAKPRSEELIEHVALRGALDVDAYSCVIGTRFFRETYTPNLS